MKLSAALSLDQITTAWTTTPQSLLTVDVSAYASRDTATYVTAVYNVRSSVFLKIVYFIFIVGNRHQHCF